MTANHHATMTTNQTPRTMPLKKNANIVLIGPMGAGKTTVGKQLASRLGKSFCDVDQELEKRTGVPVNLIFDIEKEAGFRLRETAMLTDCSCSAI